MINSLIFTSGLFTFNSNAQCTPDPLYADSIYGAWPDTVTNFVSGQVGVAYIQVLDFKLPLDAGDVDPGFAGVPEKEMDANHEFWLLGGIAF